MSRRAGRGVRAGLARGGRRLAVLAALGLAAAPLARAQLPAAPAPAPATAPASPTPSPAPAAPAAIPLPDVAARAEDAARMLRELGADLAPEPAIVAIEDAIPDRKAGLERKAKEAAALLDAGPSLRALADLEVAWSAEGQSLGAWSKTLTERATALEARIAQLGDLEKTWRLTLDQARAEHAPDALVERARSVLADVRAAQGQVQARRAVVLTLQDQVARLGGRIDEEIDDIRAARGTLRGRLFEADQPPFWRALREAAPVGSIAATMGESLVRHAGEIREYEAEHVAPLAANLLLFAALLPVTFTLRRHSRQRRAEARTLGASEVVLESPIALALLAALLIALLLARTGVFPALVPPSPRSVRSLFGFALMLPPLFLLPRLVAPDLRPVPFVLAGFYLLDRMRDLLEAVALVERSLFAAEIALALVGVLWLARSRRLRRLAVLQHHGVLFALAWRTAALLLVASLAANALGYVTLAHVLGEGVLHTGYLTLILFAGASVLRLAVAGVLHGAPLQRLELVRAHGAAIQSGAERVVAWLGVALWALVVARLFQVYDPIYAAAAWALGTPIQIGSAAFSLGAVLTFALTIAASVWVSRGVALVLEEEVFPRTHLERGVPYAIATTARYTVLLFGFMLAVGAAGLDWTRMSLLAGAFGVGVGFGLQAVVNNFVSGLILLYERPIQVGDTVQLGELVGEVRRIGIRSSTLRTAQGAEVIVPNGSLLSDKVVNWTLSDPQRLIELAVSLPPQGDPQRVLALLHEVAVSHPDVLQEPAPVALLTRFTDAAYGFELRAFTSRASGHLEVKSELALAVHDALERAGIVSPAFPPEARPAPAVRAAPGGRSAS